MRKRWKRQTSYASKKPDSKNKRAHRRCKTSPRKKNLLKAGESAASARHFKTLPWISKRISLAMAFSQKEPLKKRKDRRRRPPSYRWKHLTESREKSRPGSRNHKKCQLPYIPPFICDPPFGKRLRHPHRPGTFRPQWRKDNDDLHTCTEQRRQGSD